jgi:sugar phosphate permease
MLYCIRFSPAGVFWVQWLLVFLLGFCIYGPQMLIGLVLLSLR